MNRKSKEKFKNALGGFAKSRFGLCRNDICVNRRRHGSAYCRECSQRHAAVDPKNATLSRDIMRA